MVSILLYLVSTIIYVFHQRKISLNTQESTTNGAAHSPEGINDEEQNMAKFLKEQEI
jgi:hypothetical protein